MVKVVNLRKGVRVKPSDENYELPTMIEGPEVEVCVEDSAK